MHISWLSATVVALLSCSLPNEGVSAVPIPSTHAQSKPSRSMSLHASKLDALRATDTTNTLPKVDLFYVGAPHGIQYPCFRQPAIVQADHAGQKLIAFAEGRNVSSCAPSATAPRTVNSSPASNEVGGLVVRTSNDSGASWSLPSTVYSGNIDFYAATFDNDTKIVTVFLQEGSDVQLLTSMDGGSAWNVSKAHLPQPPAGFASAIKPAVGHGIQIRPDLCGDSPCPNAGRLVVPFVCSSASADHNRLNGDSGACPSCHACLLYSDDHGQSWSFGGIGQAGSRESQAVQTASDTNHAQLYVTERNMGNNPGHRMYARSTDAGSSLSEFGIDKTLVTPVTQHWTGIVASVQTFTLRSEGAKRDSIVYAAASDPSTRQNITLCVSSDAGHSWMPCNTLWSSLGGYTDLVRIGYGPEPDMGIIFENGKKTFADRISFTRVPYSWLSNEP